MKKCRNILVPALSQRNHLEGSVVSIFINTLKKKEKQRITSESTRYFSEYKLQTLRALSGYRRAASAVVRLTTRVCSHLQHDARDSCPNSAISRNNFIVDKLKGRDPYLLNVFSHLQGKQLVAAIFAALIQKFVIHGKKMSD